MCSSDLRLSKAKSIILFSLSKVLGKLPGCSLCVKVRLTQYVFYRGSSDGVKYFQFFFQLDDTYDLILDTKHTLIVLKT